jgi:hypothetical protein
MEGPQVYRPLSKAPPDVVAVTVHLRPMAAVLIYCLTALVMAVAMRHSPLGGWR